MTLLKSPHLALFTLAVACSSEAPKEEPKKDAVVATKTPTPAPQAAKAPAAVEPRRIGRPLTSETAGMVLVDRMDIAHEGHERSHKYQAPSATPVALKEIDLGPKKGKYFEDGRTPQSTESFQVKVIPRQDHQLVRAYAPTAKEQKLRVFVDDKPLASWVLPGAASDPYAEAALSIKGSTIGDRSTINIRIENESGVGSTSYLYWLFGKPDRKLDLPVTTSTQELTLTDRLDVGTTADESGHTYVIEKPTYAGERELKWPERGTPFLENGRATKTAESFRMKVTPGKDHVLIKAYDNSSKDQTVRVVVDGQPVGNWTLPNDSARYGEGSFRIPAQFVGSKNEIAIRLEFVSASKDVSSFYYWLYAEGPAARASRAP